MHSMFYSIFGAMIAIMIMMANGADPISLEACRSAGFDPYQLSCSTCTLLPEEHLESCRACCLSYKTLEKRTHRYQAAVLVRPTGGGGYYTEVDSFWKEDWEGLLEAKGDKRLFTREVSMLNMPPTFCWFNELPASHDSMAVDQLAQQATEVMTLDGWKRDDIRDMLQTILADK